MSFDEMSLALSFLNLTVQSGWKNNINEAIDQDR